MNKHRIVTCHVLELLSTKANWTAGIGTWDLDQPSPPQGKVLGHVKGHRDSAELVGKVNKVFVFKEEIMA